MPVRVEVQTALVEIVNERGTFDTLAVGNSAYVKVPTNSVPLHVSLCDLLKKAGHPVLSKSEMREMHDLPVCILHEDAKGLTATLYGLKDGEAIWKRLQHVGTARSTQAAVLEIEEEEEPVKPKIVEVPRGSVPDDGWYFTSYRLPLDLARQLDAIAKDNEVSLSNVVISLLRHGVTQYGPTKAKSDLEASKHAKPKPNAPAPAKKEEPPKKEATKELQKKPASGKQPFRVKIVRPASK